MNGRALQGSVTQAEGADEPSVLTETSTHNTFEPLDSSSGSLGFGALMLEAAIALTLILGLFLIVARFLPRWLGRAHDVPAEPIEVLAARRLDGRRSVYLLRVEGRRVLVGSSEAGLRALDHWSGEDAGSLSQEEPA